MFSKQRFRDVSPDGAVHSRSPGQTSPMHVPGPFSVPGGVSCMEGRDPFPLLPQVAWERDKLVLSSAPLPLWWDILRVLFEV